MRAWGGLEIGFEDEEGTVEAATVEYVGEVLRRILEIVFSTIS